MENNIKKEFTCVKTLVDKHGFAAGSIGCIVEIFDVKNKGYLIDIVDDDGNTVDCVDYSDEEVKAISNEEAEKEMTEYHLKRKK